MNSRDLWKYSGNAFTMDSKLLCNEEARFWIYFTQDDCSSFVGMILKMVLRIKPSISFVRTYLTLNPYHT